MSDQHSSKRRDSQDLSRIIERIERRKLRAGAGNSKSVWLGLGVMGMIGWSVAIPTILGTVLGIWLDKRFPQSFSWTLTFLIAGAMLGSFIAYNWVSRERDEMNREAENEPDNEKKDV